jgi:hypothetical protein
VGPQLLAVNGEVVCVHVDDYGQSSIRPQARHHHRLDWDAVGQHDGDVDHNPDLVTPWVHCHHHIDRGINCINVAARVEPLASASTVLDASGLSVAVDAPHLRQDPWHRYSASGALTLEPLSLQHTGSKSSTLRCFKEALAIGYIPQVFPFLNSFICLNIPGIHRTFKILYKPQKNAN